MEARFVAAPIALALIVGGCAPPPPAPGAAAPRRVKPAPRATALAEQRAAADRGRPRLLFVFDVPGDQVVPVPSSLDRDAPTAFEGRDGEEGEIRRSLMRPGPAGDETWYEIETSRGRGFVRDDVVTNVRWEPAEGAPPAPASQPTKVAHAEPPPQHRVAYDVQFVESPAVAPIDPVGAGQRASGGADVVTINASHPGERIEVTRHLVQGQYTAVDFYSEHCGPCRKLAPKLAAWSAASDRLAVRKVDIDRRGSSGIDWGSPVAQQYHLSSIPYVQLYGPDGDLLDDGEAALSRIEALARR
jgi:thiol-disulfide isomerase/thioredoxin